MQKWEYLFVEVVSESGGTFHYRMNGENKETDTLHWTSRKFFNELGEQGWEMISAIIKDKEWSAGGMYVFKRSLGGLA
jgi:hypothetical protein